MTATTAAMIKVVVQFKVSILVGIIIRCFAKLFS